MRLRHPREWRSAYASWSAGARPPTRAEARWFCVAWAAMFAGMGGARWWDPIGGVAVAAAFVWAYVGWWRLRPPLSSFFTFTMTRERDMAERTGWPPRLVAGVVSAAFAFWIVSVVLSWVR